MAPLVVALSLPERSAGRIGPSDPDDPDTHILYVYSRSDIAALGLVPSPDPKISDMEYVQGTAGAIPRAGKGPVGAPPLPAPNPESGNRV